MDFIVEVFKNLFASEALRLHKLYYLWKAELVKLELIFSVPLTLASYSIHTTLIYFVRKHLDLSHDRKIQLLHFIFQIQDTTKRKLTDKTLRMSEQRWQFILKEMMMG
jgi:PAS domain-containing protein